MPCWLKQALKRRSSLFHSASEYPLPGKKDSVMSTQESIERTDRFATQELIHELRGAMSGVCFDRLPRVLYSTDVSIYRISRSA
jgi:hypothetical protein